MDEDRYYERMQTERDVYGWFELLSAKATERAASEAVRGVDYRCYGKRDTLRAVVAWVYEGAQKQPDRLARVRESCSKMLKHEADRLERKQALLRAAARKVGEKL